MEDMLTPLLSPMRPDRRRASQSDTSSWGGASPIASSRPPGGEESRAVGTSSHSGPAK